MIESAIQSPGLREEARTSTGIVAAVSAVLAAALAAWGTYGEAGDQGNGEFVAVLGVIAVATAVVFGWVVPRSLRKDAAGVTALALSALGLVTIVAFWSGLPPVLAAGGIVLGFAGWTADRGASLCRAAAVLGALAIVVDVVVYMQDMAF